MKECEPNAAAVLTLTMCGIICCISLVLKSHALQHLPNFTSHSPSLFTPSHLQPACLYKPASWSHTPHWHAARSCRPLLSPSPSQTEWEKFTLAFSFFCSCSEAVVMVMGYKDSSGSQCTHEWEEHWVCVCMHACLPCIMPWKGSGVICQWSAGSEVCFIGCWTKGLITRLCFICFGEGLNKLFFFFYFLPLAIFVSLYLCNSDT